ncbi:cadherin-related family member 2 [Scomber scombrus]|uniref:cadherin-related family member 2 n=1 Tax=Scomber scombrus TaxID=13677 RepID=UPI002DDB34A3|nr:cadherin-related family member 2 [Scomber scombrus]
MLSDMEGITGSILLLCLISFANANTSPVINTVVVTVCEDLVKGQHAFTIDASDAENDPLTYALTGPNAASFTVDPHTGEVLIERPLDREATQTIDLGVTVSDGPNTVSRTITIIVNDANDNKPQFMQPSYEEQVPENTTINASLFRVQATDADTGNAGVVKYSIVEVTPPEGASLFAIGDINGFVTLKGHLDFAELSTFYRLRIKASDSGGSCASSQIIFQSNYVFAFINVEDVPNLDPVFINVPYIGKVEENSPVSTSVFKVTAIDQDLGINDIMAYSIENSSSPGDLFTISNDGVITVHAAIDREIIGDTVTLTVKATESKPNIDGILASTTAEVQINIDDINDNPPKFYKCTGSEDDSCVLARDFTGEVSEHSLGSIPIDMTVRDLDRYVRTELTLGGPYKDVFSVEPSFTTTKSIVQLVVKQPQELDFEKIHEMVLQVIAEDQEKPEFRTTATVTIQIKDINDNSPKFPQNTYKLNVTENSPDGTEVATIIAEDPDTMDQGKINYTLLPDSILRYFDVVRDTGKVYVKSQALLDREVRALYSATLQATDTDGKPGTTVLEITIIDINDNKPVPARASYVEYVMEGQPFELKIEATDADDPDTDNSKIMFKIVPSEYSDNFTIDADTGVLKNKGEIDREAMNPELNGRIKLQIDITDKGTPPLSTVVNVTINVEDVNDNKPIFKESSYKFSVKEGEKGEFVGSVFAEDLDQSKDFNRISFSITDGNFGSFIIRTFQEGSGYRGNITVDPDIELDYESARNKFTLTVEASDLEQEKATVKVEVDVVDVNDERPVFLPTKPVTVKENTTITGAIGRFEAEDEDGDHSLIFELVSIKCNCNGSVIPCDYVILDPTGEVRLNPEETLDYELCKDVLVEARVVDENTQKGENSSVNTEVMVINIEDINDNAPEFIFRNSVYFVVSETANKGTSVAEVTATDRDSGVNRQIEFEVTSVHFENSNNHTSDEGVLFEAVTTQQKDNYIGMIQTTKALDVTLKGKYLVAIKAVDSGGLATSTLLEIFTVDKSYRVELRFVRSKAEVESDKANIVRALSVATKAAVQVVSIDPDTNTDESRTTGGCIMLSYFVFPNGTALASNEVEKMLSDPEHFPILGQLGLVYVGGSTTQSSEVDPGLYILLGMVGGLIIVLAVLTTSLVCTRRNYKRKLKAAKAMNSVSHAEANQKSGPVVPGTNKYTMEGANPVLNLIYDTALVLDLDEESSDVDKVSLNSLDYSDTISMSVKDPLTIMEEDEEDESAEYIEPLGAALAQRGQKNASNNVHVGFVNPAFSTADL